MSQYIIKKNNIQVVGNSSAAKTLVFAHGYGSNQTAWRFLVPAFEERYRIVLFDLVGCGMSELEAFDPKHYKSLHSFADDFIAIGSSLELKKVHFIAHSASGMVGTLAALKRPELFSSLVFINTSPRYLDDNGYVGGFSKEKVGDILNQMGKDYTDWASGFASVALDAPEKPELADEFAHSLAQIRPDISISIANRIFLSDHRADVAQLKLPVLIIQAQKDPIVPQEVGEYLHRVIPNSQLHWISTPGHFPHMTNPSELIPIITKYLERVAG